jgi:hypothetical protein
MQEFENPLNTAHMFQPVEDFGAASTSVATPSVKSSLLEFIGQNVQVFTGNQIFNVKPEALIEENGQRFFKASDSLVRITNADAIIKLQPEQLPSHIKTEKPSKTTGLEDY